LYPQEHLRSEAGKQPQMQLSAKKELSRHSVRPKTPPRKHRQGIKKPPAMQLTYPQADALKQVVAVLERGKMCTLQGRTGTGKTFMMANVFKRMRKPTIILCYTEELAKQITMELQEHFPDMAQAGLINTYTSAYEKFLQGMKQKPDAHRVKARQEALQAIDQGQPHIIVATVACLYTVKCNLPQRSRPFDASVFECMHEVYGRSGWMLMFDESHKSLPACNGEDKRRVNWPFLEEKQKRPESVLFVSATPGKMELELSWPNIVDIWVRPNGIINPEIIIQKNMAMAAAEEDAILRIERLLERRPEATVLMNVFRHAHAKQLIRDLKDLLGIEAWQLKGDMAKRQRGDMVDGFKRGETKVLIGSSMLQEGLSFPHVELVFIFNADKHGETALTQMIGRATRNHVAKVVMYTDKNFSKKLETVKRQNDFDRTKQLKAWEEGGFHR